MKQEKRKKWRLRKNIFGVDWKWIDLDYGFWLNILAVADFFIILSIKRNLSKNGKKSAAFQGLLGL